MMLLINIASGKQGTLHSIQEFQRATLPDAYLTYLICSYLELVVTPTSHASVHATYRAHLVLHGEMCSPRLSLCSSTCMYVHVYVCTFCVAIFVSTLR